MRHAVYCVHLRDGKRKDNSRWLNAPFESRERCCRPRRTGGSVLGGAEPASTRRFDDEDVSRIHLGLIGAFELFDGSVLTLDPVAAQGSGLTPIDTKGRYPPVAGKDGRGHRLAEDDPPAGSIASPLPTGIPGAPTDLEAF